MTDDKATERTERCDVCRWWDAPANLESFGTCRRHAPTVGPPLLNQWPRTTADAWCREYDPPLDNRVD